jgi:hypothetical protein
MDLHWISNPATQWGVIMLALLATLPLFLSLKREVALHSQTANDAAELARNGLSALAKEVVELRETVRTEAPPPPRPGEAINLTRRSHALRMYARGEGVPSIAAALRIPQNEIRLLVKLNQTLSPALASGVQYPESMTAMLEQERS